MYFDNKEQLKKRAGSNFILTLGGQDAGLTDGMKVTFQGLNLLSIRQHLGLKILHQSLEIPGKMHFGNQFFSIQRPFEGFYTICKNILHCFIYSTFHSFVITYSSISSECSKNCSLISLFSAHLSCRGRIYNWAYLNNTLDFSSNTIMRQNLNVIGQNEIKQKKKNPLDGS